jgi:transposase InsO family protein
MSDKKIEGANASPIACQGKADIKIKFGPFTCLQTFYICEDDVSPLLGRDFMRGNDVYTRPAHNAVYKDGKRIAAYDLASKVRNRVALISSVTIKPGEEIQTVAHVAGKQSAEDITCMVQPARSLFIRTGVQVARTIDVPTQRTCRVRILNTADEAVRLYSGQTVGTLSKAIQTRPYADEHSTGRRAATQREVVEPVAKLQTEEEIQNRITQDLKNVNSKKQQPEKQLPPHLQQLFERSTAELSKQQQVDLQNMLSIYRDVFAVDSNDIGTTRWVKHDVDTGNEQPVRQRPRRLRYEQRPVLQNTIRDLHDQGRIRPSNSEWASNVVLVRKKATDPKSPAEWRMCIDYRELNLKTRNKHSYMLPRIDDTLDALNRARYFCTLDIQQGYHNVQLTDRAVEKTAFHVPCVNPPHWEWTCMPFGLVGAPRTFQRLMDRMLRGLEHKIALAYLDDVIVYGASADETLKNLECIFERILAAGVKLKAKKCHLFQRETTYLGHVISHEGVKTEPAKVEAVQAWHPPRTIKQLRSFLGMVCYYSKFIRNFADISQPLYALLKGKRKIKEIDWTDQHDIAFGKLKSALVSSPVLAYPTPEGQYILDTDASQFALGAVLTQIQKDENGEDVERVIAYYSKIFNDAEQRYCARRREMLAIKKATQHFEVYLRGPRFIIRTDHASLQYIKTLTTMNDQMYRWVLDLEVFDYVIQIRAGKDHVNADTLSRIPCAGKICICRQVEEFEKRAKTQVQQLGCSSRYAAAHNSDTSPTRVCPIRFTPKWTCEELRKKQQDDLDLGPVYKARMASETRPKWETYSMHSPACKAYFAEWKRLELHNEILYRRWENPTGTVVRLQILIPRELQRAICRQVHDGRTAAHLGKRKTIKLLIRSVHWFKMDHDVTWGIRTCPTCQLRKRPQAHAQAPSKPYISGNFNERVAMDIVGPMKKSQRGNIYILTITDHFTKFSRAVALPDQKARTVADAFIQRWIHDFQPPMQLHTDQGANFESDLMYQVCKLYKIEKTRTTPYHPQGNAQCERYNQSLMNTIAKLVNKDTYDDWDEQLPIAIAAYNATEHTSTGYTPNRLLYGRELPHELDRLLPAPPSTEHADLDEYVQHLERNQNQAYDVARAALGKAVKAQSQSYNRKQNLHHYKTGDVIKLKDFTQPETGTKKFKERFKGPYYVLDALSDIHYRIVRGAEFTPRIVHHDAMEMMYDREPEDLSWVYKMSRTFKEKRPTTITDVTKAMDDVMQRLKQVENQVGASRTRTGRIRRPRERTAPKRNEKEVSDRVDCPKTNTRREAATRRKRQPLAKRVDDNAVEDIADMMEPDGEQNKSRQVQSKVSDDISTKDPETKKDKNKTTTTKKKTSSTTKTAASVPKLRKAATRPKPKTLPSSTMRLTRATAKMPKANPTTVLRRSARPRKPKNWD